MKWLKSEWPQLLVLLLPFCAAALLWDRLPDRMPSHWNARGEIDGYASKTFAACFVPLLNVALAALLYFLSFLDPKIQRSTPEARLNFRKVFRIVRLAFSTFMTVIALAILAIGTGLPLDMTRTIGIGLAVMLGILGNFMGKVRPNYFVGFRTPWTLESPEVWVKTHRLAGRVMVGASLLLFAAALALCGPFYTWTLVSLVICMAVVPTLYSFVLYRRSHLGSAVT
jgi:uncharacterized membrane protein